MSSLDELHLMPLIPIFPSSIRFLDLVLPIALLAFSLFLHVLFNSPPPPDQPLAAHIYQATTAHARFLPTVAKHVFAYPLVVFGLDVGALEAGKLDMDLVFGWEKAWRLTNLRRGGYLYTSSEEGGGGAGIRAKLDRCLEERGVKRTEVGRVYLVTMPGFLGFQGINPLSVYYCYGSQAGEERQLKVVVMEVHNTFGERHVYVVQCGVDEDEHVAASCVPPRAFIWHRLI